MTQFPTRSVRLLTPFAILLLASSGASADPPRPGDTAGMTALADSIHIVGPTLAHNLASRIAWQSRMPMDPKATLVAVQAAAGSVLAVDSLNEISLLRADDGRVVWTSAVGSPSDRFLGIYGIDDPLAAGKLFALFSTELYVLDAANGSILDRQSLAKIPGTSPVLVGRTLVYGAVVGHLVAHDCLARHEVSTNAFEGAIVGDPVAAGDLIVVTSHGGLDPESKGKVATVRVNDIGRRWVRSVYDKIEAGAAISEGTAFAGGTDQYLRAFDLRSGDLAWRRFFTAPLVDAPIALGDRMMQRVPGLGLFCFAARPDDKPNGELLWVAPPVSGRNVGTIDGSVAFWEATDRRLSLVDPARGSVRTVDLPQADGIFDVTAGPLEGSIFAFSADGRIVRLDPRDRPAAAAAATP